MKKLWHGTCTEPHEVKELADWINEIHRWGLSVHGPSCENDVKICLTSRSGRSRVSDVDENMH